MDDINIEKVYDPKRIEEKCYKYWLEGNYFHTETNDKKKPFTIVIPPPNITGVLHMGHALQGTLQDSLTRYHRMRNYESLWMPGTDHAGIATQNVVEKELAKKGLTKEDLGREKFIEEMWDWKVKHGNIIRSQWEKLGCSCDWERERFTLDEGLSRAVREVFVRLYKKGLIYRGKYIVNWCPRCVTAISDQEVNRIETAGHLWHINYPLKDGSGFVSVATTRPETMLGDTAVAVNPNDERYKKLIGKIVLLPLVNREIPVVADDAVETEFGTGAVKVTPAHDPADFDIGNRHNLERIIIMDSRGIMTEEAGKQYSGMDRDECRKKVVEDLQNLGHLLKIEDYTHSVGRCSRCKSVIEPSLSIQWFVKMKPLAERAIKGVRKGEIVFYPKKWEDDYYNWMENIRDWCISRQLWWGHRIPVWYCQDCGELTVEYEDTKKCGSCKSSRIKQDADVLDTWFSSWLWPFSTMGWPDKTPELNYYYPTTVLVSGYDILFFWIARMIMAGYEFLDEKPYSHVYITGMIKDELGRWMSKSLGNGIDPLEMIDCYGADSVRYSLVALATEGQDIKLSKTKFEMGRNFGNKIWNAFRFLAAKRDEVGTETVEDTEITLDLSDKWILSRLEKVTNDVTTCFNNYKLNEALHSIYNFIWHEYCDWYIELVKNRITAQNREYSACLLNNIAVPIFEKALFLIHPFMPFITEEIWQNLGENCTRKSIMVTMEDETFTGTVDEDAESIMNLLQDIISEIRTIRGEMNVPAVKKADVIIVTRDENEEKIIKNYESYVQRLAKTAEIKLVKSYSNPGIAASGIAKGVEIYLPLEGLIDITKEKIRLEKDISRFEYIINSIDNKLTNENFLKRAPADVIVNEKNKKVEIEITYNKIKNNLCILTGKK
ncbi:valine--tRNA ligase [candidate division KSB1 bacterium]